MSESVPEVLTPQQAYHPPDTAPKTNLPQKTVQLGDRQLTVKIAPQKIEPGDETGKSREERHVFAIYLQDGSNEPVRYRTVESPMEHLHRTNEEEHNNATNEAKVIEDISQQQINTRTSQPDSHAGFVRKLPGSKSGVRTDETFSHVESGIAGYTLWDTLKALESYSGAVITPAERELLELELVSQSLAVLEQFSDMGYRQRHPHMSNFQVGEDVHVSLIDYSRSHKFSESPPVDNDFGRFAPDSFIFVAYLESYFPDVLKRAGFTPDLIEMGHVNDQGHNKANLQKLRQRVTEQIGQYSAQNRDQVKSKVGSVMLDNTLRQMGFTSTSEEQRHTVFDAIDQVVADAPTIQYDKAPGYVPAKKNF